MKRKRVQNKQGLGWMAIIMITLAAICPRPVSASIDREIEVGDTGISVTVPGEWREEARFEDDFIQLRMRAKSSREVGCSFSVQVLPQGDASAEQWVAHHAAENLFSEFEEFHFEVDQDIKAGVFDGHLFQIVELKGLEEFGLLEALVFARSQVFILRYLHELSQSLAARKRMDRILASFTDSPETLEKARLWYEKGQIVSFNHFGFYLQLPSGWIMEKKRNRNSAIIRLPFGGTFQVFTFPTVSSGLERLKELLRRQVPAVEFGSLGELEAVSVGLKGKEAFCWEKRARIDQSAVCWTLGLHERGGYAVLLESDRVSDEDLAKKVLASSHLLRPCEARKMRVDAVARFKRGIHSRDLAEVCNALSSLVLFLDFKGIAGTIASGFGSTEEIQIACAKAFGNAKSIKASRALEKAVTNRRTCSQAKKACIRALGGIGGAREQRVLNRVLKKVSRTCSPDIRHALKETLRGLPQPQPPCR